MIQDHESDFKIVKNCRKDKTEVRAMKDESNINQSVPIVVLGREVRRDVVRAQICLSFMRHNLRRCKIAYLSVLPDGLVLKRGHLKAAEAVRSHAPILSG